MSQFYQSSTSGSIPSNVAIDFVTDDGIATPIANVINVLGSNGLTTSGSSNTITIIPTGSSPASTISDFDDFINVASGVYGKFGWSSHFFTGNILNGTATNPGQMSLSLPSVNDGSFNLSNVGLGGTGSPFALGGGSLSMNFVFNLSALSDGSDTYTIVIGLMPANTAGITVIDGCYFKYTNSVNGGNWQVITTASSVSTTVNTSTPASTGFHNYNIQVNAAGTSVAFFIDGVQVSGSPLTTNIPTAGLTPNIGCRCSAGTTPTFLFDLFYYTQNLTVSR